MKKFIEKHKWLLGLFIPALILLGVIAYLYSTNRLEYVLSFEWNSLNGSLTNLEAWFLSGSLIIAFISGIFINLFSSILYDILFSNKEGQMLKNSEKIIEGQVSNLGTIAESHKKLDELIKKSNIDSHDIEQYLKNLPLKNGKDEVRTRINEWYQTRKISLEIKELLLVVIASLFVQNEALANEITHFKTVGETDFARVLENIQKHFQGCDAEKIKLEYFSRKEKKEKKNILVLKQSIKATKSLYAFPQTADLYKELILLEPTAENYFQTAYFLKKLDYFDEAASLYQKILKIYQTLALKNPRTYLPDMAITLNNLAILHADRNEFIQAQEKYEEALKIRRELAQENPTTFLPDVAMTLNNLAILQKDNNEFTQVQKKYEEALKIYRDFAQKNPKTYLPDVVITLNNLAILHSDKNEFPQAQEKYKEVLKIQRELANEDSRTYLPDVAMTLNNLAILQKDNNEFLQAQIKYEETLTIYRYLAQENSKTYQSNVAATLNNLAVLQKDNNEFPQAQKKYEEALKIQRELAKENPKMYLPDVAMTLNNLAILQKDNNEFLQAQEKYEEALNIYKYLAQENSRTYLPTVAKILTNLTILHSEKNEFPQAQEKYEEALKIYSELAQKNPQAYETEYAQILVMGVDLFKKNKSNLKIAKDILERYQEVYRAQELLEQISEMEQMQSN
ncbi:MAG: tetratricopeptide repeat protein [Bacteroidales bacterium]|nr:tetratricopeptide repeat protein [Bacteroidales bacterium]